MSMTVRNNIPALATYNTMNNTSGALSKVIQKLSTGLRINSAADDAAGLAISEKMRAQINGLSQATINAEDGISMLQTAEGALAETHSILQRMRELSVQAANDTLTTQDRNYIQLEIDQLRDEITNIGNTTQFNTKKLLNGDAAALWSSDQNTTKAIINGVLRKVDQFGQKKSIEGNYKLAITADPGTAQVQKTDIMKVKHKTEVTNKQVLPTAPAALGLTKDDIDAYGSLAEGTYTLTVLKHNGAAAQKPTPVKPMTEIVTIQESGSSNFNNASVLLEVTDVQDDGTNITSMTLLVRSKVLKSDGSTEEIAKSYTLIAGDNYLNIGQEMGVGASIHNLKLRLETPPPVGAYNVGDFAIYQYKRVGITEVKITTPDGGSTTYGFHANDYAPVTSDQLVFSRFVEVDGKPSTETIVLNKKLDRNDFKDISTGHSADIVTFDVGNTSPQSISDTAIRSTKLYDIDKFWTSEGKFMIEDPKTITITQGDGKQTAVTLYANDTISEVEDKLNKAIGEGLGQNAYTNGVTDRYVRFVEFDGDDGETSVAGTFVINSAVAGKLGELHFSASEDILNALSLNELRASSESRYTVSVVDAHTGAAINGGSFAITGNKLIGAIDENVGVEFDSMLGSEIKATLRKNGFALFDGGNYVTYLHLADNTTVFQVGANEGEDMHVNIGDMRATALGLDSVLVTDRKSAARSITIIDNALDKVSAQRARIGAYQNRLEHKINNLTTSHQNLSSAESRIRDTDMAQEMMTLMKLQIALQAGTSMLAQANQLPQNVLSLIR